jgi:hypothetical protein
MAKKAYKPYLKASLYEQGGALAVEPLEVKAGAAKKKWLQISKERKGSPGHQTGRPQNTRSQAFKRSDR